MRLVRLAIPALLLLTSVPLAGGARIDAGPGGRAADRPIRVLLLEAPLITVGAAGKEGLELRDQTGRALLKVDPGRQLRISRNGGTLSIEPVPQGDSSVSLGEAPESRPTPPLRLQELQLEPIDPQGLMVLKQRRYRGTLLLRPEGDGLQAINRLPLESYLAGVVGSEMPSTWPQAALKAQAVASRTYALQQLRPKAPFDLKATVASQVYKGVETESASVRQAVAGTRSRVLMHGPHLINAVFHSSSGGITENSGDLWSRQLPYLVSVPDFDGASPVSRWEKAISPEALRQAFAEIGGVTAIEALQSSKTGRLRQAKVIGPLGELVLSGSAVRQRLGLRSTLVQFHLEPATRLEIASGATPPSALGSPIAPLPPLPLGDGGETPEGDGTAGSQHAPPLAPAAFAATAASPGLRLVVKGRGYGHGVGMSQWGAYALALRGKSYEDILRYYYRGAVLRTF